ISATLGLGSVWRASQFLGDRCDLNAEIWEGEDLGCVDTWIRSMGARIHRRPLSDEQVAFYRTIYDRADEETVEMEEWERVDLGFRHVLITMLSSPWATYHVEVGDGDGELDAYELANRLSYHFWQSSPDDALYAAAADGSLLTDEGYRAQVERVAADPKTARSLEEFFADWLRVEEIPRMDARLGTPIFDAFAEDTLPSATLHEAMGEELVALGVHHVLESPGSFDTFFQSDRMVTHDGELAALYGGAPWNGAGEPGAVDGSRAGLLTRAGMVATGSANTRPIMKGVFVREGLLCEPLGTPPDNANASPPELSETQTTRQVVEALTEQPGSSCAACHADLINPLGFATEGFDGLGRPRTEQTLYAEWGEPLTSLPIDSADTSILAGQRIAFSDATDLTDEILASGAAHRCFAREFFRFTYHRAESSDADDCSIQTLGDALVEGQSLDVFLQRVALQPQFRTLAPPAQ
ncbi:MAG: DUF1592 domain-containing protein, partial [Myxococcota bacterium]